MIPPRVLCAMACLALGCGARSQLGAPELRDGPVVGGGGSAGNTATGGQGGAGGGPVTPCGSLQPQASYRSFDVATTPDALGYQPRLALTRADGTRVTLLVREQPSPVPIDGTPTLTQVSFEPWDSWPAAPLGTSLMLSSGDDFVLPRQAEEGLTVWLFMSTFVTGPQMALFQAAPVDIPYPTPIVAYPKQSNTPAFVTTSATSPSGTSRGLGRIEPVAQALAWLDLAEEAALHPDPALLGCFLLDGIRTSSGFLFACSSSSGFQVGRFGPTIPAPETTHEQLTTAPAQLQMVPRSDGGWVVWQAAYGETSGALMAMRLDADGVPVTGPMQLIADGQIFERVALAPMGDALAVAHSDVFDPGPPNIVVEVFDGTGTQRAAGSFTPQAWPRIEEGYGLVASPSADALLLSWSSAEAEPGVAGNARVYTARLDCAP